MEIGFHRNLAKRMKGKTAVIHAALPAPINPKDAGGAFPFHLP